MAEKKLPFEWIRLKFTDVLDVQGGTQPPKSQFIDEAKKGYVRLLQIRDFGKKPVPTFIPDTTKLKKCDTNDLLIGRYGASLGRICSGMEGAYNVALAKVISPKMLDSRFIQGYLNSEHFQGELRLLSRSAQNGFNKSDLDTFDFLLPPLAEQKVIADKLDTLLAQVENTKARLERIPQIFKHFRQSVLAAAVSGRLTEEWRGSHEYGRFDLKLEKTSEVTSSPLEWQMVTLVDACEVVSGNAFKSNEFIDTGTTPAIKISNIQYGVFEKKNQQYLPESYQLTYRKFKVLPGDLLMALTRPITNDTLKICRYPISEPVGLLNQRVAKFFFSNEEQKEFFELLFQSNYFKLQVYDKLSETLQPNLSPVDLKKFIIALPSSEEQTEIVRRVDQLFAYANQIEQQVNKALARVNNLTQSILTKAFRGELTEQWRKDNPDLISGENSAEALLEKIRVERAAMTPAKRTRKSKANV